MAISRIFLAGVAAVALVAAALPAGADDAQDKVVATVDGAPIKESDLVIAEQDLGSQLQSVPEAAKRDYLIRFLADLKIGAKAAEDAKLQDTPEARKKLYDDTVSKLQPETELHARHILVDDEAIAKQVAERAKKGEDFVALSKEFSKDPGSASDGGDLGWFTKDKMVKEFSDAAFKLEPGQISDPVKSQFGWHVIKVEEKRVKPIPPFDEVKDQIGNYLQQRAQQTLLLSLREKAKIVQLDKPAAPAPGAAGSATPAPAAPAAPPK